MLLFLYYIVLLWFSLHLCHKIIYIIEDGVEEDVPCLPVYECHAVYGFPSSGKLYSNTRISGE